MKSAKDWYDSTKDRRVTADVIGAIQLDAVADLLAAYENLENDDGRIPEHAWQLICDAIAKAKETAKGGA